MGEDESQGQGELAEVLQRLEGPGADQAANSGASAASSSAEPLSPVLCVLGAEKMPGPMPVCGACPKAMWLDGQEGLRCFCKVMHLMVWEAGDPRPITACDGPLIGER